MNRGVMKMTRHLKKNEHGFTLVEIMTVVAIVGLIAAMSMPNLLRAKVNANEAAALGTLRSLHNGLESFRFSQIPPVFPSDFTPLASAVPPHVNATLATSVTTTTGLAAIQALPGYKGYCFRYAPDLANGPTRIYNYNIWAIPKTIDVSGGRTFLINTGGTLYVSTGSNQQGGDDAAVTPTLPFDQLPPGWTPAGGSCFLAGTPILLANGKTLPIERIKIGDLVLAFDEATKSLKKDKVKKFFVHQTNQYLIINGRLKVTTNHPTYSKGKWIEIGKLKVGDELRDAQGKALPITSIQRIKEKVTVYNLEVNPYHTYIADGIVVHNKGGAPGCPPVCSGT